MFSDNCCGHRSSPKIVGKPLSNLLWRCVGSWVSQEGTESTSLRQSKSSARESPCLPSLPPAWLQSPPPWLVRSDKMLTFIHAVLVASFAKIFDMCSLNCIQLCLPNFSQILRKGQFKVAPLGSENTVQTGSGIASGIICFPEWFLQLILRNKGDHCLKNWMGEKKCLFYFSLTNEFLFSKEITDPCWFPELKRKKERKKDRQRSVFSW